MHTPGHSKDGISVLVEEDRVLFAGDVFLPVPYIVDGDISEMRNSLELLKHIGLENVIQGHGDIILRGEVETFIEENNSYLDALMHHVNLANKEESPLDYIKAVDVETCGKSRIHLGGLAEQLHQQNLASLYTKVYNQILPGMGQAENF